jgi:cellobiose-specific phosphotransferase system component IIC
VSLRVVPLVTPRAYTERVIWQKSAPSRRWFITSLKVEVIDKMAALITAAFGLIAALAWNGAIQELFSIVFGEQSTLVAMFVYAVVVTIIAVIAVVLIGRAAAKAKKADEAGSGH